MCRCFLCRLLHSLLSPIKSNRKPLLLPFSTSRSSLLCSAAALPLGVAELAAATVDLLRRSLFIASKSSRSFAQGWGSSSTRFPSHSRPLVAGIARRSKLRRAELRSATAHLLPVPATPLRPLHHTRRHLFFLGFTAREDGIWTTRIGYHRRCRPVDDQN